MNGHPAVVFLRQAHARAEELARAALDQLGALLNGADREEIGEWYVATRPATGTYVRAQDQHGRETDVCPTYGGSFADHIALHDPVSVLRRVAAERELLADLQADEHLMVDDGWYSCAAATDDRFGNVCADEGRAGGPCDCGRDARVERRVRLLAQGWGWEEEQRG
ncbi:DUF6221 family protein [Kitasatospora sp. NBC_01302]|uniref:DUF6221 family protein n=1 Tax=Kitasatospora sp. NBC_01302 TaxID=2903575 RepID=UPI002E145CE9|nr:DUF6221 family protein [Kitasatospora sp. NBC_01302]